MGWLIVGLTAILFCHRLRGKQAEPNQFFLIAWSPQRLGFLAASFGFLKFYSFLTLKILGD
jgi:hypothetical protein